LSFISSFSFHPIPAHHPLSNSSFLTTQHPRAPDHSCLAPSSSATWKLLECPPHNCY
jgi:hypothetical protein